MCYDAKTSLTTYLISSILSTFLFLTGDKYDKTIAIFCLTFGHMQLIEYLMWMDQNCGKINHYATILGHILLMLQPISVVLTGYMYNTFNIPSNLLVLLVIIAFIPLIYVLYINYTNTKQLCSREESSGHLEWNFVNGNTEKWSLLSQLNYLILLMVPWLFLKDKTKGISIFLIIISTYVYTNFNFHQWESYWCFIANLMPLFVLLLRFF